MTYSGATVELSSHVKGSGGTSFGVHLTVVAGGGITYDGYLLTKAKGYLK